MLNNHRPTSGFHRGGPECALIVTAEEARNTQHVSSLLPGDILFKDGTWKNDFVNYCFILRREVTFNGPAEVQQSDASN